MEYATHKGLTASVLGVGTYALSGAYGRVDPGGFTQLVHRALDLGVTFFDTAEAYGDAERVLGRALGSRRHASVVATKVGIRKGLKPRLSREYILNACESSLMALETDYIDLYQVHFDDPTTPVAETVAALEELRAAGKIRYYGVGHLEADRVREYCAEGEVFSVLAELSAAEPSARERLLPLCLERGVAMIAFSVTARGLLTGSLDRDVSFPLSDIRSIDPLFRREALQSALRVSDRLGGVAARIGYTRAQAAIAWVLAQEGVMCALTGPSSIAHLEENIGAAEVSFPPSMAREFESFLADEARQLREEQTASVSRILGSPLAAAPGEALADLVYAAETSLRLELTSEAEILPLLRELLALRAGLEGAGPRLDCLRAELSSLVRLRDGPEPN